MPAVLPGVIASVDSVKPTVSVTAPAPAAVLTGTVTLTATAADNYPVAGVQFFVDGVAVGAEDTVSPYTAAWNTAGATPGAHTVTARARDAAGNQTLSAGIAVTVTDQAAPTVVITSPTGGSQANSITITAAVSDNVGVVGVQFKVDGANLGAEAGVVGGSASVGMDTHLFGNGNHTLTALARDAAGNTALSAGVVITVANSTPAGSYLDFGSYQELTDDGGGNLVWGNGRFFVKDRGHHNSMSWQWANGNDKAMPGNPNPTYYQMRISALEATSRTESDGTYPHVVGVWVNGSEVADIGNWYGPSVIGWGLNISGGETIHLEKWVVDGGNDAYTAFFAEAGMRVYYDFVPKYAS